MLLAGFDPVSELAEVGGAVSPDCVKSLWSSYTGLHLQRSARMHEPVLQGLRFRGRGLGFIVFFGREVVPAACEQVKHVCAHPQFDPMARNKGCESGPLTARYVDRPKWTTDHFQANHF
jgi:hypothetical protein